MAASENSSADSNFAIEVLELTKRYDSHLAVDKVSFNVVKGSIFGLLGPNGAGKSTTIKMLTTLLPPTSGTAIIQNCDIVANPEDVRHHIGYVPQLLSADGELTAYENLLISAKLYALSRESRKQRIEEILNFMGLFDHRFMLVNTFSGGMIRRLEIGLALLHQPEVLFLDEPTVGLDPAARMNLWKYIQEWRQKYGTTILLTTHDMDEADRLCDVVAFMHQGHLVAIDSPEKLKAALGPKATLDNVFIEHTGTSIKEGGDYSNVQQTRHSISSRE